MTCYAHFITSFLNNVQTIMLTIIVTIQVRQWVRILEPRGGFDQLHGGEGLESGLAEALEHAFQSLKRVVFIGTHFVLILMKWQFFFFSVKFFRQFSLVLVFCRFSLVLRCLAVEIRAAPGLAPANGISKVSYFHQVLTKLVLFFLKSAQLSVLFCFFDFQVRALTVFSWPRRDRGTALVEIQHWQYISCQNQLIKYCAAKYCAKCSLSLNCFPSPTFTSKTKHETVAGRLLRHDNSPKSKFYPTNQPWHRHQKQVTFVWVILLWPRADMGLFHAPITFQPWSHVLFLCQGRRCETDQTAKI